MTERQTLPESEMGHAGIIDASPIAAPVDHLTDRMVGRYISFFSDVLRPNATLVAEIDLSDTSKTTQHLRDKRSGIVRAYYERYFQPTQEGITEVLALQGHDPNDVPLSVDLEERGTPCELRNFLLSDGSTFVQASYGDRTFSFIPGEEDELLPDQRNIVQRIQEVVIPSTNPYLQ